MFGRGRWQGWLVLPSQVVEKRMCSAREIILVIGQQDGRSIKRIRRRDKTDTIETSGLRRRRLRCWS